jgi:hypothetical protein
MKRLAVVAVAALVAGCASPGLRSEFGEGALRTEHFDALDSAVALHLGVAVAVVVQEQVGSPAPTRRRPDQIVFPGTLLPTTGEFVLLRQGLDTLRIGKSNVVGMYLQPEGKGAPTLAAVIGAVALGVGAAIITVDARSNTSTGTKLVLIPTAVFLGAIIGALLSPEERRGERIYPLRPVAPAPAPKDTVP